MGTKLPYDPHRQAEGDGDDAAAVEVPAPRGGGRRLLGAGGQEVCEQAEVETGEEQQAEASP